MSYGLRKIQKRFLHHSFSMSIALEDWLLASCKIKRRRRRGKHNKVRNIQYDKHLGQEFGEALKERESCLSIVLGHGFA